jgi:hypothetical protein
MRQPLVLRPHPLRQQPDFLLVPMCAGLFIWFGIWGVPASQVPGYIGCILLASGVYILTVTRTRVTVTLDEVRVVEMPGKGAAARSDVGCIRIWSDWTVLYDRDGHRLLRWRMRLTNDQLLDLAEELDVPLWDHRRWYGWGHTKTGTRLKRGTSVTKSGVKEKL